MLNAATAFNLERKAHWADHVQEDGPISGVYQLTTPRGKRYIGSSVDIGKRIRHHEWSAKKGHYSRSPKLYLAYAKYGDLESAVLIICGQKHLRFYEQLLIDSLRPELNCSRLATGVEQTPEVRAKIGAKLRRRITLICKICGGTFEVKPCYRHRQFCSIQCSGIAKRGVARPEVGNAISVAKRGKGNGLSGRPTSDATKSKISASLMGRRHSAERIAAIRAGRWSKC